jgi:murein DD-endopeptidase MepM/ murein hydrolase activator NlpD
VPRKPRKSKPHRVKPAGSSFKRMATTSFSVGAMAVAGLLAVGMTTPAGAVASAGAEPGNPATSVLAGAPAVEADDIQAYVASEQVENVAIEREEGYAIASLADIAKADGINHTSSLYWNDPTAAIQWPFPVGVPMSFGYGMRWGRMHQGIDLTPGNGAKIQAIADGVVRSASNATGGYGVNIYIDHIIDGRVITSHYAHMQYGSMRVSAGDHVKVGDVIGVVGNTGHSFGAHLHFEILVQGTIVDPLSWMRKNAGRASLG